ncbi:hypothetical protein QBC43DRAFT_359210, partial [Cladorrhinum sp. PSN259]
SQPHTLKDANISALQSESPVSLLPKTYRIKLLLGYQHIWIDSLFIIQGNRKDWLEQSPQMAVIYGGARCNVAAAWAADGTRGCFNVRDPFALVGSTIAIGSKQYHATLSKLYDRDFVYDALLNKRGWVVQERCLATRQLSFTRNQVYWECAELFAPEQFPSGFPEGAWKDEYVWTVRSPSASLKPRLNHNMEGHNRQSWCSDIIQVCAHARI